MKKPLFPEKQTYQEAENEISKALAWLQSIGVKKDSDRIGQYIRIFANPRDEMDAKKYFALHFEASLLVEIFRHFPRDQIEVLKKHLPVVFKGPLVQGEEKPNGGGIRARNIQYELLLGCRLNRLGLRPKFRDFKEDLAFKFANHDVFVECKRPWSDNGIEESLKDAIRQLRTRYTVDNPMEKGLIGLSIDRMANPSSRAPVFSSSDEAFESMRQHTLELLNPFQGMLMEKSENKLAGIICSFATPSETENNPGDLYLMKMDTFIPLGSSASNNYHFVKILNEYANWYIGN